MAQATDRSDLYDRTLLLHRRQSQVPAECVVYLAKEKETGQKCVYKWIRDGTHGKEVEFLRLLCDEATKHCPRGENGCIIRLIDTFPVADDHHGPGGHALVFEYINNAKPQSVEDLQWYMFKLLSSLAHVHGCGVAHRDVKPANVLYDRETRTLRLIDFGSAEYADKCDTSESRPLSRGYIAPELRQSSLMPNSASDVYAAGVIMAEHMFPRINLARFPNLVVHEKITESDQPKSGAYCEEAFAVLQLLLTPNPAERPSAASLLKNPYFQGCRDALNAA